MTWEGGLWRDQRTHLGVGDGQGGRTRWACWFVGQPCIQYQTTRRDDTQHGTSQLPPYVKLSTSTYVYMLKRLFLRHLSACSATLSTLRGAKIRLWSTNKKALKVTCVPVETHECQLVHINQDHLHQAHHGRTWRNSEIPTGRHNCTSKLVFSVARQTRHLRYTYESPILWILPSDSFLLPLCFVLETQRTTDHLMEHAQEKGDALFCKRLCCATCLASATQTTHVAITFSKCAGRVPRIGLLSSSGCL